MATGFMCRTVVVFRHFMALAGACLSFCATAADVGVAGIFPGKALLAINGAPARIVAVGQQTPEGVRVISVDGQSVVLEFDGKRRTARMGESVVSQKGRDGPQEVTLAADSRGHYLTQGMINGKSVRFVVDTGATMVSMSATEATRIGLNWKGGERAGVQTANGVVPAWRVRLDSVRVGDVTLHGVDALVQESDLPIVLLGMSFLSRMEIRNDSGTMTMKKRY